MEIDSDTELAQRAQVLLTLDHSLERVKMILLREGYEPQKVEALITATQRAMNYVPGTAASYKASLKPPDSAENRKIAICVRSSSQLQIDSNECPDIILDKYSGRMNLITNQRQETWRAATEIRKQVRRK